jgi:4-hydroxybenzoate polyprenyltransferase
MVAELIRAARPRQWTKNLIVLAGLVFSRNALDWALLLRAAAALFLFCLLSSFIYLINDVCDSSRDREHPLKRSRPVASGRLSAGIALSVGLGGAIVVLALCFLLAWHAGLGPWFGLTAAGYFVLMILYTVLFRRFVIIDVLTIAIGFVIRAVAGALIIDVEISSWLLVCTVLLALFLGLAKRRHEIIALESAAAGHRESLVEYAPGLLDQMIGVVAASIIVAYALYTMWPDTVAKFGTTQLGFTLPIVLYGIFRYLYLIHRREEGGEPDRLLLEDRPLLVAIALWAIAVIVIIYR